MNAQQIKLLASDLSLLLPYVKRQKYNNMQLRHGAKNNLVGYLILKLTKSDEISGAIAGTGFHETHFEVSFTNPLMPVLTVSQGSGNVILDESLICNQLNKAAKEASKRSGNNKITTKHFSGYYLFRIPTGKVSKKNFQDVVTKGILPMSFCQKAEAWTFSMRKY